MPISISDFQVKPSGGANSVEQRLAALESVLDVGSSKVTLSFGGASITISATGIVTITAHEINMTSNTKLVLKSSGDLTMKAAKISQN